MLCSFQKAVKSVNHETAVQGLNVDNKVNELADLRFMSLSFIVQTG